MRTIRVWIIVLATLVVVLVLFSLHVKRDVSPEVYKRRAGGYFDEGQYGKAVRMLREAITISPSDADAYQRLGVAYGRMGRLDEARACFLKAIELDPSYAEAHFNLGRLLEAEGKYREAAEAYRKAEKAKGDYPKARRARAHAQCAIAAELEREGHPGEAEKVLREAISLDPQSVEGHYALGKLLLSKGRFSEAIEELNLVVQLKPGQRNNDPLATAYFGLGKKLVSEGKLAESIRAFQMAVRLRPEDGKILYQLGLALLDAGNYEKAKDDLALAFELSPSISPDAKKARSLMNEGIALMKRDRFEEARVKYELAKAVNPAMDLSKQRVCLLVAMGRVLLKDSRSINKAVELLRKAEKIAPDFPGLNEDLALAWRSAGNPRKAVIYYEKALKTDPGNADTLSALGDIYLSLKEYSKAEDIFLKLGERGIGKLATCYRGWADAERDPRRKAAILEKYLKLKPSDTRARANMLLMMAQTGRAKEAVKMMEMLLEKLPRPREPTIKKLGIGKLEDVSVVQGSSLLKGSHRWVFYSFGREDAKLGVFTVNTGRQKFLAGETFRRKPPPEFYIMYEGPDSIEGKSALCLTHDGRKKTVVYFPPMRAPLILVTDCDGTSYIKKDKWWRTEAARAVFPRGIPPYLDYHFILASIYRFAGEEEKAIGAAAYHRRWAERYLRIGYFDECAEEIDRALDLNPDDYSARLIYAELLSTKRQYRKAAYQLEMAMKIRPDDPLAINDMGVIYAYEKKYSQAEQMFLRAIELKRNYLTACENLIKIYKRIGSDKELTFWKIQMVEICKAGAYEGGIPLAD